MTKKTNAPVLSNNVRTVYDAFVSSIANSDSALSALAVAILSECLVSKSSEQFLTLRKTMLNSDDTQIRYAMQAIEWFATNNFGWLSEGFSEEFWINTPESIENGVKNFGNIRKAFRKAKSDEREESKNKSALDKIKDLLKKEANKKTRTSADIKTTEFLTFCLKNRKKIEAMMK